MTCRVEHPERRWPRDEAISIEAATRYIDISVEALGAFGHARGVIRQHRESIDMAAIPRRGGSTQPINNNDADAMTASESLPIGIFPWVSFNARNLLFTRRYLRCAQIRED